MGSTRVKRGRINKINPSSFSPLAGKGTHFDPAMVEAFVVCEEGFKKIAAEHADRE